MKSIDWKPCGEYGYTCAVDGEWREQDWLLVELRVTQRSIVRAGFRFYRAGETEPAFRISQKLQPGVRLRAGFPLSCLSSKSPFMMPRPGQLKSTMGGEPCRIGEMARVEMDFEKEDGLEKIELFQSFLTDAPEFPVESKALVDEMGQIAGKDWPGKFHSTETLTAYLRKRRAEARSEYPAGYSQWGGWLEKRFDKTGYFHTHFDGRRWWLVDPDGYAFLSNGACYGNRMGIYSLISGVEQLAAALPDKDDPLYGGAYLEARRDPEFAKRNGEKAGENVWMFNFTRANMMRAFGADWWNAWADINGALLKSWGYNTLGVGVGNYPDENTYAYIKRVRIPFVLSLVNFPKPEKCLFRDFPDVFDPVYEELSREYAKQLLPYREEPLLIGYFLTNEPEWLFQDVSLARLMLREHTAPFARREFIQAMREKYGRVEDMNWAWQAEFASFEALDQPVPDAFMRSPQAIADLTAFDARMIRLYAEIPSRALRTAAPHHLNLGMRYSAFKARAAAGYEHYDVFSYNCYQPTPVPRANAAAEASHLPLMVGEWHFCGYDRGLLASGLVQAHNQQERAKAIRYYTEQAFAHPSMVGIHYFELFDQPALGRFDGATGQSGLIDVCNQPYPEVDAALKEAALRIYPIADGRLSPTEETGLLDPHRIY